ncbi:MAG: hypothetical protein LH649_12430 [Pseudanabaena sp. CAN_BIN31]|nr:hypothetical protein [Pseudanabaena sp. CAN_BIN31]
MRGFIRDFRKRVAEIDKYFELVDRIEQLRAFSAKSITFPSGEYVVDGDLQNILKSYCYILLYNLIESSIRNGIVEIHDAIKLDKLTYRELNPKIKTLWLENDRSINFIETTKKSRISQNLRELINKILDDEVVFLDENNISISGNLNAVKIKSLIETYGFAPVADFSDSEMHTTFDHVVNIRCDLAHGNKSFCDASNEVIWNRATSDDDNSSVSRYLVEDKGKIVKYLTHLLQNIDDYIENKKYKLS